MYSSRITDFSCLLPVLEIAEPPARALEEIALALSQPDLSISSLFCTFFEGSGVPFPLLFDEIKHTFDPIIDLSQIDSPGFRAKIFAWATTGSPCIGSRDEKIHVSIG